MEKAILVAHKEDDSVNEALELCESAGYKVVHVLRQKYWTSLEPISSA